MHFITYSHTHFLWSVNDLMRLKLRSVFFLGGGDPVLFYLDVCTSPCVHSCTWVLILAVFSCFPTFPVLLCWCNCNWRLGQEYSGSQRNGKQFCCCCFPPLVCTLYIIIIIMHIYHAFISALSAYMIHINLNIFYTHVEHSPTKTIYIKFVLFFKRTTNTHTHTHTLTVAETGYWY